MITIERQSQVLIEIIRDRLHSGIYYTDYKAGFQGFEFSVSIPKEVIMRVIEKLSKSGWKKAEFGDVNGKSMFKLYW